MIGNYVLTGLRHFASNKLYTFVNLFGLTIALASCTLILLFVRQEISHDQHLEDADRIVRLHSAFKPPDEQEFLTVRSAGRMKQAIADYASNLVDESVRLLQVMPTVRVGENVFYETVTFADSSFFSVFDLPFVSGSAGGAFNKPGDLVISRAMAIKYFGRTDVIGEVVTFCCIEDQPLELPVRGVIEDLPETSHLAIEMLVMLEESMFDFAPNLLATWTSVNTFTYFKLAPAATAAQLKQRIWHWIDNESPFIEMLDGAGKPTDIVQPNVMPITDIYLRASQDAGNLGDMRPLGNIRLVYAFVGVTALILILAAINFMNLATARAMQRTREVGLRKLLGASRRQIAAQFLGEALALTSVAMLLAMALVELFLPLYNEMLGRDLDFSLVGELQLFAGLVFLALVVGLVAGSYPAFYLSRFTPAQVLRSNSSADETGSRRVRAILVVFQFAVSVALGICTAVIYSQTQYAQDRDPGYNAAHKLVLHGAGTSGVSAQREVLTNQLRRIPQVESVTLSSEVPSQDSQNNTRFQLLDGPSQASIGEDIGLNYHHIDEHFFASFDMELVAGRTFSADYGLDRIIVDESVAESVNADSENANAENAAADSSVQVGGSVIINMTALKRLGIESPEQALGLTLRTRLPQVGPRDLTIVGVAKDVNFRSLRFGVRPTAFMYDAQRFNEITVALNPSANVRELRDRIEQIWRETVPMNPISLEFLSAMLEAQYQEERQQSRLFTAFSLLALCIASLGLYGLAFFSAERRTREISIRKVLGARVIDVTRLLVWQFSRPVLLANVLAWPIACYLSLQWLENYEYRLPVADVFLMCVLAGAVSLALAWATVAGRALRVARASPIIALRRE